MNTNTEKCNKEIQVLNENWKSTTAQQTYKYKYKTLITLKIWILLFWIHQKLLQRILRHHWKLLLWLFLKFPPKQLSHDRVYHSTQHETKYLCYRVFQRLWASLSANLNKEGQGGSEDLDLNFLGTTTTQQYIIQIQLTKFRDCAFANVLPNPMTESTTVSKHCCRQRGVKIQFVPCTITILCSNSLYLLRMLDQIQLYKYRTLVMVIRNEEILILL